jgi:ankyrin repeat protein
MEILRKAGADVNARITDVTSLTARIARANTLTGRQGQTAVFYAAESGRTEVVKYLLQNGAKTDLVDDMGRSPIDFVEGARGGRADNRSKEITALLQKTAATSR